MLKVLNPNEIPWYIEKALTEEWESLTGEKIVSAIFCCYSDYRQLLTRFGLEQKGCPHVCLSRKILEARQKHFGIRSRPYNPEIRKFCLATWNKEDERLYVAIIAEYE